MAFVVTSFNQIWFFQPYNPGLTTVRFAVTPRVSKNKNFGPSQFLKSLQLCCHLDSWQKTELCGLTNYTMTEEKSKPLHTSFLPPSYNHINNYSWWGQPSKLVSFLMHDLLSHLRSPRPQSHSLQRSCFGYVISCISMLQLYRTEIGYFFKSSACVVGNVLSILLLELLVHQKRSLKRSNLLSPIIKWRLTNGYLIYSL